LKLILLQRIILSEMVHGFILNGKKVKTECLSCRFYALRQPRCREFG
jgi:hypothetical protein